jgi:hypothetical protein
MNLRDPANGSIPPRFMGLDASRDSTTSINLNSNDSVQLVMALEAEIGRLQTLVCYLLHKNEQLRFRNSGGNAQMEEPAFP